MTFVLLFVTKLRTWTLLFRNLALFLFTSYVVYNP